MVTNYLAMLWFFLQQVQTSNNLGQLILLLHPIAQEGVWVVVLWNVADKQPIELKIEEWHHIYLKSEFIKNQEVPAKPRRISKFAKNPFLFDVIEVVPSEPGLKIWIDNYFLNILCPKIANILYLLQELFFPLHIL